MIDDFFALEPLLVTRLTGIPGVQQVYRLSDLAQLAQHQAQRTPAIFLTYDGTDSNDAAPGSSVLQQNWVVAPAEKSLAGTRDASAARAEIGGVVMAVIGAVHGWQHGVAGFTPLEFRRALRPQYLESYMGFPLVFTTSLAIV